MNTRVLNQLGGIARPAQKLAIAFLVIVLGTVALPLTNGFIGEFLLLMGVYNYNFYYSAVAGLTIILGAVYMLRMYQKAMFGVTNVLTTGFKDLDSTETSVLLILSVLVIGIGIYPQPILHISEAAITNLLEQVNQKILVK